MNLTARSPSSRISTATNGTSFSLTTLPHSHSPLVRQQAPRATRARMRGALAGVAFFENYRTCAYPFWATISFEGCNSVPTASPARLPAEDDILLAPNAG